MILDDLVSYVAANGGGSAGVDIFAGYLPEASPSGVPVVAVLYETGGMASARAMGTGVATAVAEYPRVQVVCRAAESDYVAARDRAHVIYRLLDGLATQKINAVEYKWVTAVQSPFLMGRDAQGRVLVACNYQVVKDVSPAI